MRVVMWVLLTIVAGAAAVLSFTALRDLAVACGFAKSLAWLLPVTIDAGAAVGCLVWLGQIQSTEDRARRFARALTWSLLVGSVAGNAVVHALAATDNWWLAVVVSAVPPAVLGSVVHLAVLLGGHRSETDQPAQEPVQKGTEPVIKHMDEVSLEDDADRAVIDMDQWLDADQSETDQRWTATDHRTARWDETDQHPVRTDEVDEHQEAVQKLADQLGKRPSRQAVRDLTGVGATRADRLRNAVRTTDEVVVR